jgi:hypothetical protein
VLIIDLVVMIGLPVCCLCYQLSVSVLPIHITSRTAALSMEKKSSKRFSRIFFPTVETINNGRGSSSPCLLINVNRA